MEGREEIRVLGKDGVKDQGRDDNGGNVEKNRKVLVANQELL